MKRVYKRDGFLISIHAPREGSDLSGTMSIDCERDFYPRSPRGERRANPNPCRTSSNFYPRSPRGERLCNVSGQWAPLDFYPRSPRGERRMTTATIQHSSYFYPRSPRGERHDTGSPPMLPGSHFYPRSPRGERHAKQFGFEEVAKFLSTLPARGATLRPSVVPADRRYFYPRSPRGERQQMC